MSTSPTNLNHSPALSLEDFSKLAGSEKIVSNWVELHEDMETPVSVYAKLRAKSPDAFILESVEQGERIGRYTIIGYKPLAKFEAKPDEDCYALIEGKFKSYQQNSDEAQLPFFHKGFVGYFAFESVKQIEPSLEMGTTDVPESAFMLVGSLVVFDHLKQNLYLIANADISSGGDLEAKYKDSLNELAELEEILQESISLENLDLNAEPGDLEFDSNTGKEEFMQMVQKAKDYIVEGDVFQVVISHKLSAQLKIDPLKAYRVLRAINPSPYLFLLNMNSNNKAFSLVGSSPEMLVKCTRDDLAGKLQAELRPIAGTYRRGKDAKEDQELAEKLLNDEKEIAEHIMLLDLGRNDLGRVCEEGSIKVAEKMIIEKYSHVLHIVSSIIGHLKEGENGISLLKACFPAGTLSGAPKVRALEIINELEKEARGPYGGCVCYIGLDGSIDTAMTIRTLQIDESKVQVQAGAGIVYDSVPETEFQETLNKAGALMKVVKLAQ